MANNLSTTAAETGNPAILLVEDEQVIRRLISHILAKYGYSITTAACAEEAIEQVTQRQAAPFQLLICDLHLPGMNGVELGRCLRETLPALKILYISGGQETELKTKDLAADSTLFLHKPFTPPALISCIKQLTKKIDNRA